MKLIEVIKWENDKAVVLVYADSAADLGPTLVNNGKTLTVSKGSLGYLADGKVYVFGNTWTKIGG